MLCITGAQDSTPWGESQAQMMFDRNLSDTGKILSAGRAPCSPAARGHYNASFRNQPAFGRLKAVPKNQS
jgi:hypothetical protein